MKKIFKNTTMSIGIALAIFCIIGIIVDITNQGNFTLTDYSFSKMVLGTLLVGIGFGAPAIVYDKEHLPFPIQTVIHMGTGCIVYTITAFFCGLDSSWVGHWNMRSRRVLRTYSFLPYLVLFSAVP